MHKHTWILVSVFLIGGFGHACAESLDDNSIRNMYAEASAAIQDANKTVALLQQRLDDNYTVKANVAINANGQSQNATQILNKTQVIQDAITTYGNSQIQNYHNQVDNIQYSPDHQLAYVNEQKNTLRAANAMEANGQSMPVHYNMQESCSDVVALVGATLKIMRAECNAAINVGP